MAVTTPKVLIKHIELVRVTLHHDFVIGVVSAVVHAVSPFPLVS